jgi:hypothetical protein
MYLLMGVVAPIGLMVVPGRVIVRGDAAATAANLRASEGLFRLGFSTELFHQALGVFLVLALYRLFKPVNEHLARQLVALGALVSVPITMVNVLNQVAALTLAKGPEFLTGSFTQPQLDGLAYLCLRMHNTGIDIASIFWGLWLIPFGLLVIRSRFIPAFLGVLLIIAGTGYLASAVATFLLPQYAGAVGQVALILEIGEVPIIFWLLIWGAREPSGANATPESAGNP